MLLVKFGGQLFGWGFFCGERGARLVFLFVNLYKLVVFLSSSSVPLVLVFAMFVMLLQFMEIKMVFLVWTVASYMFVKVMPFSVDSKWLPEKLQWQIICS